MKQSKCPYCGKLPEIEVKSELLPQVKGEIAIVCEDCGNKKGIGPVVDNIEIYSKLPYKPRVVELRLTCEGFPAQWEGKIDNGDYLYVRYRYGTLRASSARDEDIAVCGFNDCSHYVAIKYGDAFSGEMNTETMITLLKPYFVFTDCVISEDSITFYVFGKKEIDSCEITADRARIKAFPDKLFEGKGVDAFKFLAEHSKTNGKYQSKQ